MASGGFGIAAHVRLRFAFPLDWTRVSCRKYGYESDFGSPVQAQRSFFLCGTMPGNVSRRRTTTRQLTTFAFSLHEMSQCIGPMDNRTEQAKKALGRSTYDVEKIRYISISF